MKINQRTKWYCANRKRIPREMPPKSNEKKNPIRKLRFNLNNLIII